MKIKLVVYFLLLSTSFLHAAEDEESWSKTDNGVQGRLFVLLSEKADSPFCRVFIEFQNTANILGQKKISFAPSKLDLSITDKAGKSLPKTEVVAYDAMIPIWEPLLLPYAGTIKFQISFPGMGYHPRENAVVVDVGADSSWIIPPTGEYFLGGSLSISKELGDRSLDWNGSITFPRVMIPTPSQR